MLTIWYTGIVNPIMGGKWDDYEIATRHSQKQKLTGDAPESHFVTTAMSCRHSCSRCQHVASRTKLGGPYNKKSQKNINQNKICVPIGAPGNVHGDIRGYYLSKKGNKNKVFRNRKLWPYLLTWEGWVQIVILPWKLAINKARGHEVGDHSINCTESRGESANNWISTRNLSNKMLSTQHKT